jgi:precorrin-6A synthase
VMLDAGLACQHFDDPELDIYWGAYLGTPDEVLKSGRLIDVAADIARTKQELRAQHGWIMDTYLLRRRAPTAANPQP